MPGGAPRRDENAHLTLSLSSGASRPGIAENRRPGAGAPPLGKRARAKRRKRYVLGDRPCRLTDSTMPISPSSIISEVPP